MDCQFQTLCHDSQVEEMLIFPVHVMMQAWSVRGGQHKYAGHCCNFNRDNAAFVGKIPQLPEDLDIIIVRSKSNDLAAEEAMSQTMQNTFMVNRS
jgi:hypothetical protein